MGCRVAKSSSKIHPVEDCTVPVPSKKSARKIVISACDEDEAFAQEIHDKLLSTGLPVWYESQSVKETGVLVVNALGLIIVLSEATSRSPVCRDNVAFTYVSNKPIIPVCKSDYNTVLSTLDFGMKLTVKEIKWVMFSNGGNNELAFIELADKLDDCILFDQGNSLQPVVVSPPMLDSSINLYEPIRNQQIPSLRKASTSSALSDGPVTAADADKLIMKSSSNFWVVHFGSANTISWIMFQTKFLGDYKDRMQSLFGHDQIEWVLERLHSDVFKKSEIIHIDDFLLFQGIPDRRHQFWRRVKDYVLENHLLRQVFSMNSTVRLSAVQNLAKFRSSTVVAALIKLLQDQDANIRAVAALSLSHCEQNEDRLVRESCCISLGNLGSTAAIDKLAHIWRNEVIMNVRTAAEVALKRIGGEEANKVIQVTRVLSAEISMLKEELQMGRAR
ncbi:uncharacterized protein LOC134180801 isoform X2 [Corticium candelabrum]|uniref:uncharacterized protein LOC134180801 isoform X2 n=1 Tax=Corticium candelabrum TaxID=121492 RepID=UPI002E269091|nr:uncharacterized protein LOC134180801 isoform X2 [Corticium candelabrum]